VPTYYCHNCARKLGHVAPVAPSTLGVSTYPNQYQLDKFIKHTTSTGLYPNYSFFQDPTWGSYLGHLVSTLASGCLEIDDAGRKNLIFFAGSTTGMQFMNGQFVAPCNGVMAVLTESSTHCHAFPSHFHPESQTCATCGTPVPYDPRK
jgi:hypothetical protein